MLKCPSIFIYIVRSINFRAEVNQDNALFSLLNAMDSALGNFAFEIASDGSFGIANSIPVTRSRPRWRLDAMMPALITQLLVNGDLASKSQCFK